MAAFWREVSMERLRSTLVCATCAAKLCLLKFFFHLNLGKIATERFVEFCERFFSANLFGARLRYFVVECLPLWRNVLACVCFVEILSDVVENVAMQ